MKSTTGAVFLLLVSLPICETVIYGWLLNLPASGSDSSPSQNVTGQLSQTKQEGYCTKDRHCGSGNYCHRHYGTCHKCKRIGAKCRRDHVCCEGFECVFGSCRRIVREGNYLSRCRKDKNCKKGLCCAKSHGQFVCKPMLTENQICSVLEGGVAYTINHGCPCDEGLACRPQKLRRKGTKGTFLSTMNLTIRRCEKIQS